MAAKLEVSHVGKRYGNVVAAADISFVLEPAELVTLLGPSGSGKTTTMMMIAGFAEPDEGDITLDGRSILSIPPHKRNIGVVFQNYALFPHMSVGHNVEFPLRERGVSRSLARKKAADILNLVGLAGYQDRHIRQLSGGQQQRVALARALVFEPPLLIMDEPLSALDKRMREQMQKEIRRIQQIVGVSVLCVTHDQSEAFVLSDRIAVMNEGRIVQMGKPRDVYSRPHDRFVANFLGDSNIFQGQLKRQDGIARLAVGDGFLLALPPADHGEADQAYVMVRPDKIEISARSAPPLHSTDASCTRLKGRIVGTSYLGATTTYSVEVGTTVLEVSSPVFEGQLGAPVSLTIPTAACVRIPS